MIISKVLHQRVLAFNARRISKIAVRTLRHAAPLNKFEFRYICDGISDPYKIWLY